MKRATRKHSSLRRVLPFVLPYTLGALCVVAAFQLSKPFSKWLVVAAFVLVLGVGNTITVLAARGRAAPHPEYLSSWLAFGDEFVANNCGTAAMCGLLPVGWTLRLLDLRHRLVTRWWLRTWCAVQRFDAHWYSRALAQHRAAAAQRGDLAPLSVRALERTHHNLAQEFLAQGMALQSLDQGRAAMGEGEEGRPRVWDPEQIAEAAAHARMALYYAQTFNLLAERGFSRAMLHAMLARSYLGTSLQAEAERAARVREAGLHALSNAVEARWIFPKVQGKPLLLRLHLSLLEQLSQEPELQQDTRVAALLEMLKTGTTPTGLAEARASIQPQPEDHWFSQAEREEREWAAQLTSVPPQ